MRRLAELHLKEWLQSELRKPLVIRGARQVGKTELVRQFAQNNGLNLIEINLEETPVEEFSRSSFDIDRCIHEILAVKDQTLEENSLLFIDEIQEDEKAYSRLRFFKEQRPELPVIVAGSLLEEKLKFSKQKIPVGRVEYLFLGPMTFKEFLLVQGKSKLLEYITEINPCGENNFPKTIHERLTQHFKDYLFVGGMPKAVLQFASSKGSYTKAREVHYQILQSYREDVERYAEGSVAECLQEIFENIGKEVGRKVVFSRLTDKKARYVKEAVDLMSRVFLLHRVYHTNASGLPLSQTEDKSVYKLYFLDVGLVSTMTKTPWSELNGLDYDQLLSKGNLAEQFVIQQEALEAGVTKRKNLNYWLRDKKNTNAEVDIIKQRETQILPVEVKAGKSGSIKSLLQFMHDKKKLIKTAIRYDLEYRERFVEKAKHKLAVDGKVESVEFELLNLPLYMV